MIILEENSMLKIRPDLFNEWDTEKNYEMGLDVYKVTKGMATKAWWNCPKCESSYDASISYRTLGQNCPYCSGRRINHTNSLASLNPTLASDWHPTKNRKLNTHTISSKSNKIVWWMGACGHEWEDKVCNRAYGAKCKNCSVRNNSNDYKYADYGVNDGLSYPEKVMYSMLKEIDIRFEREKSFEWSLGRRYDFYIEPLNLIIEMHGLQHYNGSFEYLGGRTLEEEQENDRLKECLARENGIEKYVVIDARHSDFDYIARNIINSQLSKLIDLSNIDLRNVELISRRSIVNYAIHKNKEMNVDELSKDMQISKNTIYKYLRVVNKENKKIIQLTKDFKFIKEWNKLADITNELGLNYNTGIINCCNGKKPTAHGYIWMRKCDYEKFKNGELERKSNYRDKTVVQLLENGSIKEWINAAEAARALDLKRPSICNCCKGVNKTTGGYRWMYKEDYENYIKEMECNTI